MSIEAMKQSLEQAYLDGFNDSAEGYNGEYPFRDHGISPTKDRHWVERRNSALRQAIAEAELVQRAEEAFERSEQYDVTSDHRLMENAQGDLERVTLVQTGVGIGQVEFTTHTVETAYDWSEWVCPDPNGYLMKCCDCGLVHEAEFKVVRYKSETEREDCDLVDDPNVQAVFRMRRSEQWSPVDTAHRAGGLPMEQAEQAQPVAQLMDMIVGNLVREGVNKHRARELADHFIKQSNYTNGYCTGRTDLLKEQAEKSEPVATMWQHGETGRTRITTPDSITDCDARWVKVSDLYTTPQPVAHGEPVAWMYDIARYGPTDLRGQQWRPAISRSKPNEHDSLLRNITPLYTSPPPRQPLTLEQLRKHWQVAKVLDMTDAEIDFADYVLIARDVEALYGIKGEA